MENTMARVCRVIPSAGIRSVRPPCCRTGAAPEQGGVSLLPQAPRCYIPDPSAHLDAEEGIGHDLSGIPLSPHLRLAGSGAALNRAMGHGRKKRVRKVPSVPDRLKQQTFRTLKQVLVFFLMAIRRSQHLRRSTTASKEKTADEHGSLVVH